MSMRATTFAACLVVTVVATTAAAGRAAAASAPAAPKPIAATPAPAATTDRAGCCHAPHDDGGGGDRAPRPGARPDRRPGAAPRDRRARAVALRGQGKAVPGLRRVRVPVARRLLRQPRRPRRRRVLPARAARTRAAGVALLELAQRRGGAHPRDAGRDPGQPRARLADAGGGALLHRLRQADGGRPGRRARTSNPRCSRAAACTSTTATRGRRPTRASACWCS